ncbi:glycosyltransferase family protein [Bacillus sp. FJAT-52991]|uniref:Glycosyltransferase family protein n=1 Tax=Bacillus kandeliae TaxID=3129297 RepID=A0ABZ2N4X3_9BACI
MKIVAVIQARMGSTRLPGKILKKVMGKTLLEYQLERVKRSKLIDEIVVATTSKSSDDVIVNLCEELGIHTYRGSEDDVLSRYYEAATVYKADVVVRLTSDCPIIDPEVIDQVVRVYLNHQGAVDYVSNTLKRTFPRGMDTEVFSYQALEQAYQQANLYRDREHVTAYFYTNPEKYQLKNVKSSNNSSRHRWTVDTEEDFELITKIISNLYPLKSSFTLRDALDLLEEHKEWSKINEHIEQKK